MKSRKLFLPMTFCLIGIALVLTAIFAIQSMPPLFNSIPEPSHQGDMLARKDIRYCNTNNSRQEYDLFTPSASTNKATPLVVHVHGGGWQSGTKSGTIATHYSKELTQKSIAFASIDYRLDDEVTYPAQNDDVHCAVSHIINNAHLYNIDPENIIIMGDSAGGHLAAMHALRYPTQIKAAVLLYGVSDLWKQITQYTDNNAIHYLGKRDELLAKTASPLYQDLTNAPPFLLVHGTNDSVVPATESELFTEALKTAGRDASYVPIEGAGHGFGDTDSPEELLSRKRVTSFIDDIILK